MLRILGSAKRLCDGLTRRELLRAGGLGLFGLGLADLRQLQVAQAAPTAQPRPGAFGKAKACILLYLYGAPSQLDVFDLKPDAPAGIRSEFRPIATAVPGVQICEHLPRTAQVMDRTTLIRSLTHPYNIHAVAYTLTGTPTTDLALEANPQDPRHWPFFGSVLDYLQSRRTGGQGRREVPVNVGLPWRFSSAAGTNRSGPYAGFLGTGYNPTWCQFAGESPQGDPYRAITRHGRFAIGQSGGPELTLDGLSRRRSLLSQIEQQQRLIDRVAPQSFDRHQQLAFDLLTSPRVRQALDLEREPMALRERYGLTLFGQATLVARRLIEQGVRLATVVWDEYAVGNSAWDTHEQHYPRLKDSLLPGFDRAYAALITDMEARGLLDETLVLVLSEHGRTPQMTNVPGGGRDHWSSVYSGLLAGGGVRPGAVVGASDKHGAHVQERPISPKDVLATVYHLLGVDPHTVLADRTGRPLPLVAEGTVVNELLT